MTHLGISFSYPYDFYSRSLQHQFRASVMPVTKILVPISTWPMTVTWFWWLPINYLFHKRIDLQKCLGLIWQKMPRGKSFPKTTSVLSNLFLNHFSTFIYIKNGTLWIRSLLLFIFCHEMLTINKFCCLASKSDLNPNVVISWGDFLRPTSCRNDHNRAARFMCLDKI